MLNLAVVVRNGHQNGYLYIEEDIMDRKSVYEKYLQLLRRHRKVIWAICFHYAGGDRKMTEDLVQEVSVALFLEMDKLRSGATYLEERSWARWQSRAVIKKMLPKLKNDFVELKEDDVIPIAMSQYVQSELIEEIMSFLTADERIVIQYTLDGYGDADAAAQLGISVAALYQRRHRIIDKLKKIYKTDERQ